MRITPNKNNTMKNIFLTLLVILILASCSNEPSSNTLTDKIKSVETHLSNPVLIEGDPSWTIEERMAQYGVPGVSIAVINDNKIEWTKSYGVMNKETKSPVTNETLFQAGSISKPVAAYGALRLVEEGSINLEEDINTYLKSWQLPETEFTKEKKVTLKNLLSHSAGVTVHGFLGYSPDLPVPTLVEVLNGTPPANSGAIFVDKLPEESFRYSGGGYTIMQQMVIDVKDRPFPQLMKELVLQPLDMNNSTYDQPLQSAQLELAATGYLPDGSMTKGKRHTYPEMAAAGLWTTAEDLAKFAINIQKTRKGESHLGLSQEMTNKMLTPFVADFIGLGIFLNKYNDEIYFGHGGWDEGFSSELVAHRDKGYGVVVLTNSNHPEFISELIRSVALTYDWADFVPTYKKMPVDSTEFANISGRYRVNGNEIIDVYQEGNLLYSKGLGFEPNELIKVADNTYFRRHRNRLVRFKPSGENTEMSMHFINPADEKIQSTFKRVNEDEKIPLEFLIEGNFDESLAAYQALMKQDPEDPTISEGNLNRLGYSFLGGEKMKYAQAIFKVNTILYPESSNVYDSYAEACMKIGEADLAIKNFEKSLSLDPQNHNARRMIEELRK